MKPDTNNSSNNDENSNDNDNDNTCTPSDLPESRWQAWKPPRGCKWLDSSNSNKNNSNNNNNRSNNNNGSTDALRMVNSISGTTAGTTATIATTTTTMTTTAHLTTMELVISAFHENLSLIDPMAALLPGVKLRLYCAGKPDLDLRCEPLPNYGR
ncbi:unnamed protein product [Polarella glacialis]|uniref:Uncharacterized protein n=1 Tax=Polarella glacialis TaxID=89957 RepID=A0A813L6N8_POLGL|nr:unnamed protein product [Polarella glacialis]